MSRIDIENTSIIFSYEAQENMLLDFLRHVPYDEVNKNTHSPLLETIILNAGSLIDSLFRNWSPDEYTKASGERVSRKNLNIYDFRTIHNTKYVFSEKNVFVYLTPPKILSPYKIWSKAGRHRPEWWGDYNKIKHDRVKNRYKATFETALRILSGLFLIISQNEKMTKSLLRHDWLRTGGYNLEILIPLLESRNFTHLGGGPSAFVVESRLFATIVGSNSFPEELNQIRPLFFTGGDQRLGRFLGTNY